MLFLGVGFLRKLLLHIQMSADGDETRQNTMVMVKCVDDWNDVRNCCMVLTGQHVG